MSELTITQPEDDYESKATKIARTDKVFDSVVKNNNTVAPLK